MSGSRTISKRRRVPKKFRERRVKKDSTPIKYKWPKVKKLDFNWDNYTYRASIKPTLGKSGPPGGYSPCMIVTIGKRLWYGFKKRSHLAFFMEDHPHARREF